MNVSELREGLTGDFASFEEPSPEVLSATEGKIFGLTAVERCVLSAILFLSVSVLGFALLLSKGIIVLR